MSTTPSCRKALTAAASIGALLVLATLAFPFRDTSIVTDEEDGWTRMERALRILATGAPDEKRAVIEEAADVFSVLAYDPDHDENDAARVIGSLRFLVRAERDDWFSYRLLGGLEALDRDFLKPLFLDALKDASPNLRWRGARWFSGHTDPEALPELDDAWRHEERPWVQADLMIALVRHGSRDHSDEFLRLARGRDAALAPAAIRALTMLGDPQVIPSLAAIVRTSRSNAGLLSLDALALWPDSREALETAIEASHSPRVDFQRHAAAALGSFEDPAASARLFAMASGRGDPDVRSAALDALKQADPGALVPLTMGILYEAPTPENAPLHSAAIGVLRYLDDPSILPALASLDFKNDDPRRYEVLWLKRHLTRTRVPGTSRRQPAPRDATNFDLHPEEGAAERVVLTPPPSTLTVRCWKEPDVPGDPRRYRRLPAGTEAGILDHFERREASWVQIDAPNCWIPATFSGTARSASPPSGAKETTMAIRREFDLPADEVESDVAQGLMDAGLLEVIEPGDEVIGVALILDPEDFDQVFLLARSCGLNETLLDAEIYGIVSDLAPLHGGHPALERFRRAPEARPGETDEVLDLDFEELTDR